MVSFGDPAQAEPFEIACPEEGTGRWADARNWVFDFARDLPAGVRCSFVIRPDLRDMEGNAVGTGRFEFSTGGPVVVEALPWAGEESIDENQVFILGLDARATDESVAKNAWCGIAGRVDRVPVRVLSGKDRRSILEQRRDFLWRLPSIAQPGSEHGRSLRSREYDKLPVQVLACRARLPFEAEVQVHWGPGIETPSGVATTQDQPLAYRVRRDFSANFSCARTNAKGNCIPVLPMSLGFTAPVPVAHAERIRLTGPAGEIYPAVIEEATRQGGFVDGLVFRGPFPEAAAFALSLPAGLVDDAGRALSNASRFPLAVRTDPAPPLAKFAARFGVLELNADPALPITLRNVEKTLAGRQVQVAGEKGAGGLPARLLRVQSPREILRWMKRLDGGEARWTQKGYVSKSIFEPADRAAPLTLPRPGGEKDFEVVGIPLKAPGFYVVEVVSPRLGQALLAGGKPYYVSAGALVTNLAVHFKWGRESSLVWVTSLDRGEPVPRAQVSVLDCSGKVLFDGQADDAGIARVRKALPARDTLPACRDKWDRQLVVTARLGNDAAFTLSDWNEGIASWRFNLRTWAHTGPDAAATVFDRTLLRAGETVSMKHFIRRRSQTGFVAMPAASLPVRAVVRHAGTGQTWEMPLRWDAGGVADSAWAIPADAKLGEYSVILAGPRDKAEQGGYVPGLSSGSFRVEEFRVPVLKATVHLPPGPVVGASATDVGLQLSYLSGGGAGGQRVKLRALTQPKAVNFPGYDGVLFANGGVREGRTDRTTQWGGAPEGGATEEEPGSEGMPAVSADMVPLRTVAVDLDAGGAGRVHLEGLPKIDTPRELVAEMEYADPNGQVLTRSSRQTLWPSGVVLGLKPDGWAISRDKVRLQVIALDTTGRPAAGTAVSVDLFERQSYSHRKRLVGGFYAYEYGDEVKRVGAYCEGMTDERGVLLCEAPVERSGNLIFRAAARDTEGNPSLASAEVWVAGAGDWWFNLTSDDRMDVIPERRQYEPGETAVFQVRAPFREASALVTVEREGVIDGFVTPLSGKAPVVQVPVKGGYAPNVFVSVFAVRGRLSDVQPTALVDLGKPAFRMGLSEIKVGWQAHELAVKVVPAKETFRVREKARVGIEVARAGGKPLPKGTEVAVAAVDEGLLELLPNDSWRLLETMMQPRMIEVESSTSAMQVVGRRHYGKKALAAGGGGGRQTSRELFDTLLFWKARVRLDARGQATVDVPLNDSLSAFRIVAVASGGLGLFGTGSATIRTNQDVILSSGLPPVVREQDRFSAMFTLRNASDRRQDLVVSAAVSPVSAPKSGPALESRRLSLDPGEARNLSWEIQVPPGSSGLEWAVAARAGENTGPGDAIRITQRVVPAVPVRVLQSTLAQLAGDLAVPVALPADAIPGRGGFSVQLRNRLAGDLPGVRDHMATYPYSCLEQRASRAVALRDAGAWNSLMAALPAYLDHDGLAKYFPSLNEGSDTLTSYLLAVAQEAGWEIPDAVRTRLIQGLTAFLTGTVVRHGHLPMADLTVRKVAALDALTRHGVDLDPAAVFAFTVEPNLWPTSAVIDWYAVAKRWGALPERERRLAEAERILRARIDFQGTVMSFSTERSDRLWWLMVSGDVNANRALLAVLDEPRWREDAPRLVRGVLARQHAGRWDTTVANAWGVLALEKFSRLFDSEPVTGRTTGVLGPVRRAHDWAASPEGGRLEFEWPSRPQVVTLTQGGGGRPWATLTSRAAVALKVPFSSGYRITKTVTGADGKGDSRVRGDVVRVRLEIVAETDMTWVVVDDPVPAGSTILGTGLGGDSMVAAAAGRGTGDASVAFEERGSEAFRAYYSFVPKGTWIVEYAVRLNNAGSFQLPPTRVEAMYAPEIFGELPNGPVTVADR
jgi:hypothetical protein